jgi:peroxiredoxin
MTDHAPNKFHSLPLFLVLTLALLAACGPETNAKSLPLGSTAPAFELKNVDGEMISLAQYAAVPAVCVVFTCNHCPFAKAYEQRLISLQKTYAADQVKFILINPNDPKIKPDDSFEKMIKRAQEKSYPFPYLVDETQNIARAYGAFRTPEVYLFDPNRKLVYKGLIDDNTEEKEVRHSHLRNAIDHLLAGEVSQIQPDSTKAFGCTIKWKK